MTHSTGIHATDELIKSFKDATQGAKRFLKIQVTKEETLVETASAPKQGTFSSQFSQVREHLEDNVPCYIAMALDNGGWILIMYCPDSATIRDRMVYASTRENVKKGLGQSHFVDEYLASTKDEVTHDHYTYLQKSKDVKPLSDKELASQVEERMVIAAPNSKSNVAVGFPVDAAVADAVNDVRSGKGNWAEINLDIKKESIHLVQTSTVSEPYDSHICKTEPRFYVHKTGRGEIALIFSCPDTAPVKARMLYSTSKLALASHLESSCSFKFDKNVEVRQGNDLAEELSSKPVAAASSASKTPEAITRPGRAGRGPRKLMKNRTEMFEQPSE